MQKRPEYLQAHYQNDVPSDDTIYFSPHEPYTDFNGLHYHDELEFGYCLCGSGIFYIGDDIYPYGEGDISIIYPGERHIAQRTPGDGGMWWFISINIEKALDAQPDKEKLRRAAYGIEIGQHGHILTETENANILPYMKKWIEYKDLPEEKSYLTSILTCILYETLHWNRSIPRSDVLAIPVRNDRQFAAILPAIDYMLAHYTEEIQTDDLCECCHISPVHLRRCFSTVYGMSPLAFLHKLRIRHACAILLHTNEPVSAIAYSVGYNTLSSFNRQFQSAMHVSPSVYRLRKSAQT